MKYHIILVDFQPQKDVIMKTKVQKFWFWLPRVLTVMFALFLAIFSLDVITPEASLLDIVIGLFMHNLPSIVLIILLFLAKKSEWIIALSLFIFGSNFILRSLLEQIALTQMLATNLLIALPSILIAILFIISRYQQKQP